MMTSVGLRHHNYLKFNYEIRIRNKDGICTTSPCQGTSYLKHSGNVYRQGIPLHSGR